MGQNLLFFLKRKSGFRGLLDLFPNSAAAYSLQPLSKSTLNSPLVRVRRSSDNGELDFTGKQIIDGTMLDWVTEESGTANGFIRTWYDQSGLLRHAQQATALNQPLAIEIGDLIVQNGKPAIKFDGANDFLLSDSLPEITRDRDQTFVIVFDYDSSISAQRLFEHHHTGDFCAGMQVNSTGLRVSYQSTGNDSLSGASTGLVDGRYIAIARWDATEQTWSLRANGVEATGTLAMASYGGVDGRLSIGCRTSPSLFFDGPIFDFFVFPRYLSAEELSRLEPNLAARYGITLP